MSALDDVIASESLPLGHYDRRKALDKLEREYAMARKAEESLGLRWRILTDKEAARACAIVTEALMLPRVKRIVLESPMVHKAASAHWSRKEIHFSGSTIPMKTLYHELAHHVAVLGGWGHGHGEGFVTALRLVAECLSKIALDTPHR